MEGLSVILAAVPHGTAALLLVVTAVIGYLLGNCNGAIMISRLVLKDDVRTHGSGNGGLTNFQRTYGGTKLTVIVIAVDMLKVVASVAIALGLSSLVLAEPPLFVKYWAGIACVVGHVFPCALRFHGGKGILCGGTLALLVDWRVAALAWGLFLLGVVLTRWVSFGSVMAATAFGVASAVFHPTPSIAIPALMAGGLIVWKHRANLRRLVRGEEPKLSLHRKKAQS